jgi:translocator protein
MFAPDQCHPNPHGRTCGSATMMRMNAYDWYAQLAKPAWAPPASVFGPVWTVLYAVIFLSFGVVFFMAFRRRIPCTTALPFALNLVANFAYTPLQFGLKSNILASVDILLVWGTLIWAAVAIFPRARWIAYAQIPYLLWVTFATCLQLTITFMNA